MAVALFTQAAQPNYESRSHLRRTAVNFVVAKLAKQLLLL